METDASPILGGGVYLRLRFYVRRSGYGINHEVFPPTKCIEISSIFLYLNISSFVEASP